LAQHAHRDGIDPAVDPHFADHSLADRRDAQHHDARRAGARGRYPGGRCHGGDREHPPPRRDGKPLEQAIIDGAQQIAVPAFVATLAICIVFVSVVFLTGPAQFLFTPLALAVVYAMLASYVLSRTLVPVMAKYLLHGEAHGGTAKSEPGRKVGAPACSLASTTVRGRLRRPARTLCALARLGPQQSHRVVRRIRRRRNRQPAVVPFIGRDFFRRWTPARSACT